MEDSHRVYSVRKWVFGALIRVQSRYQDRKKMDLARFKGEGLLSLMSVNRNRRMRNGRSVTNTSPLLMKEEIQGPLHTPYSYPDEPLGRSGACCPVTGYAEQTTRRQGALVYGVSKDITVEEFEQWGSLGCFGSVYGYGELVPQLSKVLPGEIIPLRFYFFSDSQWDCNWSFRCIGHRLGHYLGV